MSTRNLLILLCSLFIACLLLSVPSFSQDDRSSSQAQNENTVQGTVVSSSSTMLVVKADDNQYHLFTFDSNTAKPASLPEGTRVRVISIQGDQAGARLATNVVALENENTVEGTVVSSSSTMFVVRSDDNQYQLFTFDRNTSKPPSLPVGTRVRVTSFQADQTGARLATTVVESPPAGTAQSAAENAAPLPPPVHKVENKIERATHRWRVGGRTGVAFDPELFLFGVHMQVGPIFSHNLFFRPNAEFAFGEITDMVSLNLEVAYRMQAFSRTSDWAPYFGAGPSLNFIHQSFQTYAGEGENISFDNFNYKTGFNVLMGVQNRSSLFFEVKASLWSQPGPVLRLIVGKNF